MMIQVVMVCTAALRSDCLQCRWQRVQKGVAEMKAIAVLLIVAGIGIVIWGAFGFKTREKVVDVGPFHASKEKTHNVPYGPIAGAIIALGGVVLLIKSRA